MKTALVLFLILVLTSNVFPQDTIYRTNGKIIQVHILKADAGNIYYRVRADTASPVLVLNKDYIKKIVHQNGRTEIFFPSVESPGTGKTDFRSPQDKDTLRNRISWVVSDLIYNIGTLEYEHFLGNRNFSIRIPVSVGFKRDYEHYLGTPYYRNKKFSSGVGIYFYPGSNNSVRFYMGGSFEMGFNREIDSQYGALYKKASFYSFLFHGGLDVSINERLAVDLQLAMGFGSRKYTENYSVGNPNFSNYHETIFDARYNISLAYKF